MEGDFPSDPFDVEEEGGGEADYTFAINGVIGVSEVDWFFQSGSGKGMSPYKPPIEAGDACATINKGTGVDSFQVV